ncbi:MAG: mannosylfructose-phosphate synthase [Patescibacteria group bacterium]|nr:MAG: mannosylfructose-phosphate synthase [Patescibacteria group bacterium]
MRSLNRVCMLNPQGYFFNPPPLGKTDTGGQIVYVLELSKALAKKGIKVDIFTRGFDKYKEEEQVCENLKIVRIPCGSDKFLPKEKLYEIMPEFSENIMKYIERKRKKYDIIHSHYWDGGYAGILLSKMLDIPHIHTPHTLGKAKKLEMDIEEAPTEKLKPYYRFHVRIAIEQKIYNKAHAILVICETTRIQLLHYYLVDFEKIHVIYPGVDTEIFNTKKTNLDNQIKLKNNSILTMCRLVPAKGIDRLIEALNFIKNKIAFHLYIGGNSNLENNDSKEETNYKKYLFDFIEKNKLQTKISFIGQLNHEMVAAYYRNADIFVNPARYEPFGLTTIEAMACGTAPLISHVAGSKEIIIDGLNGFIINSHDRKLLGNQILKLLTEKKLLKKISENAAFTIKEHYSWDKISDKIINFYKKLII